MPAAETWQLQDAKSNLSRLVQAAQRGPQTITLRGEPSAVVISMADYRRLTQPTRGLVEVMRSAPADFADLRLERDRDESGRSPGL